jgi:hypothetical protein
MPAQAPHVLVPTTLSSLHKRRIGIFVELTPNLAGTFIAICHSTDYQTRASSNGLNACGRARQSL